MTEAPWIERNYWEGPGEDPTCLGNCPQARTLKDRGWSHDYRTEYSVCGGCRKPSPYNLLYCPDCETVWLPANAGIVALAIKRELTCPNCRIPGQIESFPVE